MEYQCEVERLLTPEDAMKEPQPSVTTASVSSSTSWPLYVKLTNGKLYGCDLVVSATGVTPNTALLTKQVAEGKVSSLF